MGLVNAKEVASAVGLRKFGFLGTFMGWNLMKILKIDTLNTIYDNNKHLSDLEFVNSLLDEFEIKFEIPEEDLKAREKQFGSPEKQKRSGAVRCSHGMAGILNYQDNDVTHGLIDTKATTRGPIF